MDAVERLWQVARRRGKIDARVLLDALSAVTPADVERDDERSRMLVRDVVAALRAFDGPGWDEAARQRVAQLPTYPLPHDPPNGRGFHSLATDLTIPTNPAEVIDALIALGTCSPNDAPFILGDVAALIIDGLILQRIDSISIVGEELKMLAEMPVSERMGLRFMPADQLPDGWQSRVRSLGVFGSITAFRVDPIDVLVGKLFSRRDEDLDDVRLALPLVDRQAFVDRLATTTGRWRADEGLGAAAESNWYVITGEPALPSAR